MMMPVGALLQTAGQGFIYIPSLIALFSDWKPILMFKHFLHHTSPLYTRSSYWFQPLWLLLPFCSLILIATAHCRLCPYDILTQQMAQNMLRNSSSAIKSQFRQMEKLLLTRTIRYKVLWSDSVTVYLTLHEITSNNSSTSSVTNMAGGGIWRIINYLCYELLGT